MTSTSAAHLDPTPLAVVTAAWATFASGDAAAVAAVFTPDAEWLAPAGNAAAQTMGGIHHFVGRDAIAQFITVLFPQVFVADVDLQFGGFHAAGPVVVVEERMTATLANGDRYDNEYCFVFEVQDGLVHRVREYLDTRRGIEQFGALIP